MGGGGGGGADQRSMADTGTGGHVGAVSISDSGLSFGQRERVHQPHGGRTAEQDAHRTDQIAAAALQRQRPGGGQEWGGGAEAHGVYAHRGAARRGGPGFLRRALQPVLELSSTVRRAQGGGRRQGQGEESVSVVRHALGDPAAVAG